MMGSNITILVPDGVIEVKEDKLRNGVSIIYSDIDVMEEKYNYLTLNLGKKEAYKLLEDLRVTLQDIDADHCDNCGRELADDEEEVCDNCHNEYLAQKIDETKHPDDPSGSLNRR